MLGGDPDFALPPLVPLLEQACVRVECVRAEIVIQTPTTRYPHAKIHRVVAPRLSACGLVAEIVEAQLEQEDGQRIDPGDAAFSVCAHV